MTPDTYVDQYLAQRAGQAPTVDRLVTTPSNLDAQGMLDVIADPRLGPQVLEVLADLFRPEGSIYYDAIYGDYHGQADIRAWLIPTMALIDFVEFVPQATTEMFDDGEGGTSVDEWQMVAVLDGERIPLPKGVSVRRYRDGWITWNVDVYDTGPFRTSPDPDTPPPDLPPWPRTTWDALPASDDTPLSASARAWLDDRSEQSETATEPPGLSHEDLHSIVHHPIAGQNMGIVADLMHPTDSRYIDPLFGELEGQAAIRRWLLDVMPKVGAMRFDPVGPTLFNGRASVQEWVQTALLPDGSTVPLVRGTSVRRFADGWIVYAADYFDTAPLADPQMQQAARAAGSTLAAADIERYR